MIVAFLPVVKSWLTISVRLDNFQCLFTPLFLWGLTWPAKCCFKNQVCRNYQVCRSGQN